MFLGYLKLNVKHLSFYLINLASLVPPSLEELGRLGREASPPPTWRGLWLVGEGLGLCYTHTSP